MPAAVRYLGMFRTAAVLFVVFGGFFLWSFGLTERFATFRLYGLAGGLATILVGVFVWRRARLAIGLSALVTTLLCLASTLAAPGARGPVILFYATLAILTGIYTALSLRVLFGGAGDAA